MVKAFHWQDINHTIVDVLNEHHMPVPFLEDEPTYHIIDGHELQRI